MSIPKPHEVLTQFIETLDELRIPYMIGGSFASGIYGNVRMTYDADLVVDIKPAHIKLLLQRLQNQFYIDEEMIRNAINYRSSFNIIHLSSMFKIDVFILQDRAFDRTEFARRREEYLVEDSQKKVYVTTPEGIILSKLEWYRMGGEVSERQYQDVIGVIKIQSEASKLDWEYLKYWAKELEVEDLLERARRDALGEN